MDVKFWSHVNKTADCWLWTGAKHRQGYGWVRRNGCSLLAHRVSWELKWGVIPIGLCVLHKCDNTACVRPGHLFIGTQNDNILDAVNKGRNRGAVGERNYGAKISASDVRRIRKSLALGARNKDIEQLYKLSQCTVSNIKNRKSWKHVA